ncbi:MAG: PorV/PorQ family protein [bacterium]
MKTRILVLALIMTLLSAVSGIASEYGGVTAAPYLNLGIGARASGMGEAYTGVVDNVEAGFWNPGALVRVENPQFSLMHNSAFGGTSYEYLGYAVPAEQLGIDIWGTIGITAMLVRVDNIPTTKAEADGSYSLAQENDGDVYGAGGTLIGLSYSWQAAKMFAIGATIKLINQKVALEEGWIPALDIGILAKTTIEGFNIGLVFQNISYTKLNGAPLPLNLKFGLGYNVPRLFTKESDPMDFLNAGMDVVLPIAPANMPLKINVGLEYGYNIASYVTKLRVGYRFNGTETFISDLGSLAGMTAGMGISKNFAGVDVGLDYAYIPYGILGDTHRVSLTIALGDAAPVPKSQGIQAPKTVQVTAKTKQVVVVWSQENKDKINGYNVYMTYQPGGDYFKLTKAPIDKYFLYVGPLKSGVRIYFTVTCVDKEGKESAYSKEMSAIPE